MAIVDVEFPEGLAGFGERLAHARRAKGQQMRKDLSQADIGRAIGVARSTASSWEAGKLPDWKVVEPLAKGLGVTPGWLMFGQLPRISADAPSGAADEEFFSRATVERARSLAAAARSRRRPTRRKSQSPKPRRQAGGE